jgi:DUF438 domain-containing protein
MINNQSKWVEERKDALKAVIRALHQGKTVDQVKNEFSALLADVGGGEIAALEQELISEGLPEEEIKRLCDVHVAVFEDALDLQVQVEASAGHPVEMLRAENREVEQVIQQLEQAVADSDWQGARARLAALREYEKHYVRKENILFPYLERHGFSGPSSVMWAIHDDVRAAWKSLGNLLADGPGKDAPGYRAQVQSAAGELSKVIRDMVYKEENILVPAAMERLSEPEWRAVQEQEPTIGFFRVAPASDLSREPAPASSAAGSTAVSRDEAGAGLLALDTGALTVQQVNLLLTNLPVDVTYVDDADRVRYFSAGRERIFPRSPAIIGRQVQKCHPPASMHRVQEILDSFRAGDRDDAEFWIQMGGRFVYIRYFALRDRAGAYQGTLEVSQDVTGIRALDGEKRLLGGADAA